LTLIVREDLASFDYNVKLLVQTPLKYVPVRCAAVKRWTIKVKLYHSEQALNAARVNLVLYLLVPWRAYLRL